VRYRVAKVAETIGWDGKLTDWLYDLTADCPRKRSPGLADPCGARYPQPAAPLLVRLSRRSRHTGGSETGTAWSG